MVAEEIHAEAESNSLGSLVDLLSPDYNTIK